MPLLDDAGLDQVKAAFDAARVSPRDAGFLPQGLGPNAEAERFGGLERIWARSTHLHDNNELVDAAAEAEIDRVVGTGIDDIEPETGWPSVDDQIAALYEWAFCAVDRERSMTLAEVQAVFLRELKRTGECGVRIVMADAWGGYPAMPAIELIEAERIPPTLTGINPATGLRVRQGVEYDESWRIVAYHVLVHNPRDGDPRSGGWGGGVGALTTFFGAIGFGSPFLVRVPAGEMRIVMNRRRVRQLRGVPALVSGMRTLRTLDKYIDTSMAHAETAGSVGIIFDAQDAAMFKAKNGQNPLLVDGAGNPITTMQGVGVAFRKPGSQPPTTIHLNQPGPQFTPTVESLEMMASRALNAPFSQTSGNYTKETFASNRANRIDQRQRDVRMQHTLVWNQLTRPYCRTLVQYGLLAGRVTLDAAQVRALTVNPEILYRSNVPTPGEAYVNPQQEAGAVQTDLLSNVTSEIDVIGRRGGSYKRLARQRAKFERFMVDERRKLGLPDYPPVAAAPQAGGQGEDGNGGGDGGGGGGGDKGAGKGDGKGKDGKPKQDFASEAEELEAELAACSGEEAIEDGGIEDGVGLLAARAARNGHGGEHLNGAAR